MVNIRKKIAKIRHGIWYKAWNKVAVPGIGNKIIPIVRNAVVRPIGNR